MNTGVEDKEVKRKGLMHPCMMTKAHPVNAARWVHLQTTMGAHAIDVLVTRIGQQGGTGIARRVTVAPHQVVDNVPRLLPTEHAIHNLSRMKTKAKSYSRQSQLLMASATVSAKTSSATRCLHRVSRRNSSLTKPIPSITAALMPSMLRMKRQIYLRMDSPYLSQMALNQAKA